jgi:amphiphysin
MVEKLQGFAEGKYEVPADPADIARLFLERRGDAQERVESLGITKRPTSTGMRQ